MVKLLATLFLIISMSFAEINVITDRSDFHLKQIAKNYEKETGEKVNVFYTKKGLLQRAKVGNYDVIISKNSSEIVAAKRKGLLKTLPSSLYHKLDVNFKDNDDFKWFNMSYRIRAFYVKKGIKNPPMTYYELADPKYKGKICIRAHTHNYNLEMYGHLLAEMGEKKFKEWFRKFKSNLARKPSGNDRNQVKGVYLGECEIAIANTYYMGLMMNNPKQKAWAESVNLIIPDQINTNNILKFDEQGAIALYSGVAVLKKAKHNPERFLHYLISDSVQKGLSKHNFEYPLDPKNIGKFANTFGSYQNLSFENIKIRTNKQNELYDLRKRVYKIIKETN